ncbi:hypothetical protein WA026_006960 [Henosepilachna vigintioctopunctata]|uniref:WH2 domain-containing protein n=1 Tax=Henosepilachna vigintioctopunctata TaxID=420089 RepID=A0AAW1V1J0_9CUCU
MPGPPPPPPAAPPLFSPPPALSVPKGSDDRSALLKSIQKGTKLKKTVTNDKSGPVIGKVTNNNSATSVNNGPISNFGSSPAPNGMALGGLFAGGMPKLKPTKNRLGNSLSTNSSNNSGSEQQNGFSKSPRDRSPAQPAAPFNFSSIQNEVKKKLANDNRDRGPPPPTPTTESVTTEFNNITIQQSSSNSSFINSSNVSSNNSSLHRKTQSNVNLSSIESRLSPPTSIPPPPLFAKSINHGKPNVAPKPPILNGKPRTPPKKLVANGKVVSRAHSLKSPRSPTTQGIESPMDVAIKYGTVRNMSSALSHSLGNNLNMRSKMALNGRPSAPPPSVPGTPPSHQPHVVHQGAPTLPTKPTLMKPPSHAPPPPPVPIPQPPNHAPPPPPHKTLPAKLSSINFSPSQAPPPPPPPRNSSMRDQNHTHRRPSMADFDERFKDMFRSPSTFPRPPPFRNVLKIYSNRQGSEC